MREGKEEGRKKDAGGRDIKFAWTPLWYLSEQTLILLAWASVPTAAAPLPDISQPFWNPAMIRAVPVTTLSDFYVCFVSEYLTLLSFYSRGGGEILWYIFYDEELLTIFVLFRIEEGRGRDKERAGPIPEIHLNLCANNSQRFPEGEGTHLESVTQSFPRRLRQGQDYKCGRVAYETRSCNRSSYTLAYFVTLTPNVLFFYLQAAVFTDSVQVCGVLCRIQLYKALHTPTDALHSPFKIVKVFFNHSIHTEQLGMTNRHSSFALLLVQ